MSEYAPAVGLSIGDGNKEVIYIVLVSATLMVLLL